MNVFSAPSSPYPRRWMGESHARTGYERSLGLRHEEGVSGVEKI